MDVSKFVESELGIAKAVETEQRNNLSEKVCA